MKAQYLKAVKFYPLWGQIKPIKTEGEEEGIFQIQPSAPP